MPTQPRPLVLASASPRRRALLESVGIVVEVAPVSIDERALPGERPRDYVERMAESKLHRGLVEIEAGLVLAADTIVVDGDAILGKPADDAHALSMLVRLAGRSHRVLTSVALGEVGVGRLEALTVSTEVRFRPASQGELIRYVATGEGKDKAGGYAIQGIGAGLVTTIDGSYPNVVGLPLAETLGLLARHDGLGEWP